MANARAIPRHSTPSKYRHFNMFPPVQKAALENLISDTQFAYKSADQAFTSDATLAVDTHLTFDCLERGVYAIELVWFTTSTTNGGVKVDLDGGTATATAFRGLWERIDASTGTTTTQVSAIATDTAATTNINALRFTGAIIVNAPGTFVPRLAQNASHGDTTTYLKGSWGRLTRIAD